MGFNSEFKGLNSLPVLTIIREIRYDIVLNFGTGVFLFQFVCNGVSLVICLKVDTSRWILV